VSFAEKWSYILQRRWSIIDIMAGWKLKKHLLHQEKKLSYSIAEA
jgi:hypothetical protein